MSKERTPETTSFETENRKLAYTNEFRALLRDYPGIIKDALNLTDKAIDDYNPGPVSIGGFELKYDKAAGIWLQEAKKHPIKDGKIDFTTYDESDWVPMNIGRGTLLVPDAPVRNEEAGLELTILGRSNRDYPLGWYGKDRRVAQSDYFKLDFHGESFFVKRSLITDNPGFVEFKNTVTAKKLLEDLDFIKVIDAQLGYQDSKQSWYVSKWKNLESVGFAPHDRFVIRIDDYGKRVALPGDSRAAFYGVENEEEYEDVQKKADIIKSRLATAGIDVDLAANLFYNTKTKAFILLDVTSRDETKGIGDPIRENID